MTFQEKVRARIPLWGAHVHFADVVPTEIFSALGYDYIWVDMEHTTLTPEQVHHHILAARNEGVACVVRVPVHDLTITKRIMEIGPDGIVFPMVKNAEEARELISWTMYPPLGARGCGPKAAVRYGIDNEPEFYKNGHIKTCRFIQIERVSAAEETEQIAAIPGVDGCILGLLDLSGSRNALGDMYSTDNLSYAIKVAKAMEKHGKTAGISTGSTDTETLTMLKNIGLNMISAGADFEYIVKLGRETKERMERITGGTL